jgi:phosphatidylglycerol lysyltransferase
VERLSAEWIGQAHYREFGFVQGTMDRAYLQANVLDLLHDSDGRLVAFINEVPSYAPGEASFDMMRRLPGAPWVAMDYLFLRTMLELGNAGFTTFNLGLAPFAGVGDDPDSALLEKTMHALAPYAQRLARTEGISQYKKKFQPDWRERYVIYDGGPLALPKVALALFTVV